MAFERVSIFGILMQSWRNARDSMIILYRNVQNSVDTVPRQKHLQGVSSHLKLRMNDHINDRNTEIRTELRIERSILV